jgi:hypothetical protein
MQQLQHPDSQNSENCPSPRHSLEHLLVTDSRCLTPAGTQRLVPLAGSRTHLAQHTAMAVAVIVEFSKLMSCTMLLMKG